jgi:hypothetical protein
MNTCHVTVEVKIDGKTIEQREWPAVDAMKTSHTRGWATRQFNLHWDCRKRDKIIRVYWAARYGESNGYAILKGTLSGVNNIRHRRGIFE